MKRLTLPALCLLAFVAQSLPALAASSVELLSCRSIRPTADSGYMLDIRAPLLPSTQNASLSPILQAILSQETIVGPQLPQSYSVVRKKVPAIGGAPITFWGQGFELTVYLDGVSVPGGYASQLIAEYDGARVFVQMACNFAK